MLNTRVEWVDVAKGIGIILVVLGHNQSPDYIIKFIYSFHMPLFFFLSGYLTNPSKYQRTMERHGDRSLVPS